MLHLSTLHIDFVCAIDSLESAIREYKLYIILLQSINIVHLNCFYEYPVTL
jgi:hypothetical protein